MAMEGPRFRRDLVAGAIEADDVQYIDVTDPRNGTSFRFYDFEHAVALSLDGRSLPAVAASLRDDAGIQLSLDQLRSFVRQLETLGFLENAVENWAAPAQAHPPAARPLPPPPPPDSVIMPDLDSTGVRATPSPDDDPTVLRPVAASHDDEEVTRQALYGRREKPTLRPLTVERSTHEDDTAVAPLQAIAALTLGKAARPVDELSDEDSGVVAEPVEGAAAESLPPVSPPERPRGRASVMVYALLGTAAAAVIGLFAFQRLSRPGAPAPISVHTVAGAPASVHVWFDTTAEIRQGGTRALEFPAAGRVVQIAAAGTQFAGGDTLATLQPARAIEKQIAHYRERQAFYEKMLETATAAGNKAQIRQAEVKVAEKKRLVAEAIGRLGRFAVIAKEPGIVEAPAVAVGAFVKAKSPAVNVKGTTWQATLELPREEATRLRRLGFCRAEIVEPTGGKPLDCTLSADGGDETHVVVELPEDPAVGAGKKLRLAKGRFHDVFAIPASALVKVGNTDRVYVAGPDGRAEARAVTVGDRTRDHAYVTQGLDAADAVIVDPPPHLRPDTPVRVASR